MKTHMFWMNARVSTNSIESVELMIGAYSALPNNYTPVHKFLSIYALFYRSYLQK